MTDDFPSLAPPEPQQAHPYTYPMAQPRTDPKAVWSLVLGIGKSFVEE